MLLHRQRIERGEIVNQRPSSDGQISTRQRAVEILGNEQMPIHPLHETVYLIAGAVGQGKLVGDAKRGGLLIKLGNLFAHEGGKLFALSRPFVQTTQALRKCGLAWGIVAMPKLVGDPPVGGGEHTPGAVAQAQTTVEEAQNQGCARKQHGPRQTSRTPTIGGDGTWRIVGLHRLGFLLKYRVLRQAQHK